jgi:hypothetical protein
VKKVNFEKAERVAVNIGRWLGSPDWFLGVGIEPDAGEGYTLSVRVRRGLAVHLPERFDGVKVCVVERDIAEARHP